MKKKSSQHAGVKNEKVIYPVLFEWENFRLNGGPLKIKITISGLDRAFVSTYFVIFLTESEKKMTDFLAHLNMLQFPKNGAVTHRIIEDLHADFIKS